MATTVHRKENGNRRPTSSSRRPTRPASRSGATSSRSPTTAQYVGEGDAVGDWEPNEDLTNDDAPQSALDAAQEAADG